MRARDIETLVSVGRPTIAPDGGFAVFAAQRADHRRKGAGLRQGKVRLAEQDVERRALVEPDHPRSARRSARQRGTGGIERPRELDGKRYATYGAKYEGRCAFMCDRVDVGTRLLGVNMLDGQSRS